MVLQISKEEARRALAAYHIRWGTLPEVFGRLRSIQYDPLSPVGCNHDLVMQARIKDYKVGDWQAAAYQDRLVYDGWDKMASLVPFEGWGARRVMWKWHGGWLRSMNADHPDAAELILKELQANGPMTPRDFEFQQHRAEWKGSWYGPSVTKQTLRALWHVGQIMTTARRKGQHVYDLAERVLPSQFQNLPEMSDEDALREILTDRHAAIGLIRPTASYEVWSMDHKVAKYRPVREEMAADGSLIPVDIEGMKANAWPGFLEFLGQKPPERVTFLAPLDQIMWDRKMIEHVFGFAYKWEVYVPEHKREHGYYVLPVLYGDRFIGRIELAEVKGIMEVRRWHPEPGRLPMEELRKALRRFIGYVGASEIVYADGVSKLL